MPTVKTALVLQDKMSSVMRSMTKAIGTMITGLEGVETAGGKAFDPNMTRQMRIAVGEANAKLSEMEKDYQRAAGGQQNLNRHMQHGVGIADGLLGKVKGLVAAYASMRTIKGLVDLSDQTAQNYARVNLMNDGLQTTTQLIDSIRAAANRSRGSFQDMATVVAKLGNNARGAFKSSAEVVKFAELVQKQMKIAGAGPAEASNAMLQLSQALGSGVLRGDELNSIFEQAPNLIQTIADYMKKPIGQIRKMASEGQISADIVKNAMFDASDDINKKFAAIPMTWQDVWTRIKNDGQEAMEPLLGAINRLANNPSVMKMLSGITSALGYVAVAAGWVVEKISGIYTFFVDNWSKIAPIVYGVCGALVAYTVYTKAAALAGRVMEMVQTGINWKLLLAIAIIGALVAGFVALCIHLGKTNSKAKSTFSQFVSGIYVVGAWFKNLGVVVKAVFAGILAVIEAGANNIGILFHNSIAKVKGDFYSLLAVAIRVVSQIANALNKLPFVNIDVSGLTEAAGNFAEKAAAEWKSRQEYISASDAFKNAYDAADGNTAFADGWKKDAAKAGETAFNKLKEKYSFHMEGAGNAEGYGVLGNIADNTGKTADTTGSIAKSLDTTNEELSWIRDVAERDVINRFTTAEIKIDMTGMTNEIKNDVDVDGLFNRFTNDVRIALQTAAAGVH